MHQRAVDDDGLADLGQDAVVDLNVIVRASCRGRERAARHQDDAPAELLDRAHLLLVGGDHLVDGERAGRGEVVGAGA